MVQLIPLNVLKNSNFIQASIFSLVLICLLSLEYFVPRRPFKISRPLRIINNLSLTFLNNFLLHLSFPILALGAAVLTVEKSWGVFQYLNLGSGIEFVLGIVLLDLLIYSQHVAFHFVPFFWKFHKVHHADVELDVTTGTRFHPVEILMSMGIKISFIFFLGVPPLTVFIFEFILMLSSMFNHSNLNIPIWFDRIVRFVIITPDVHRVHHSIHKDETNSNFGFNFPWWDRLFGSFTEQPRDGHLQMRIGIEQFRKSKWAYLHRILIEPFAKDEY